MAVGETRILVAEVFLLVAGAVDDECRFHEPSPSSLDLSHRRTLFTTQALIFQPTDCTGGRRYDYMSLPRQEAFR